MHPHDAIRAHLLRAVSDPLPLSTPDRGPDLEELLRSEWSPEFERAMRVNDIDIVAIPRDIPGLKARCKQRAAPIREGSDLASYLLPSGVQLDIFFAAPRRPDLLSAVPSTWGTVLLCRTGSKGHNIGICQRAHQMGFVWRTNIGLIREGPHKQVLEIVAGETEEDIFEHLHIPFVPPALRQSVLDEDDLRIQRRLQQSP